MFRFVSLRVFALSVLLTGCTTSGTSRPTSLAGSSPALRGPLPLKFSGGPTTPGITEHDLMTRLYLYADDSMAGRAAGTEGNVKATTYIAAEFRRFGIQPAGDSGKHKQDIYFKQGQSPAYNVVGIVLGSDPVLRHQYVAIGAHNDHVGLTKAVASHDSVRVSNIARYRANQQVPDSIKGKERSEAVRALQASLFAPLMDSLRRLNSVPRRDSISNGADDDGSGTVALLELAEAFAYAKVKPKRSILLVSHTAEENGLVGSLYFTDHPTVPRDSIVAMINLDMIGRGSRNDIPQGGPRHVDLVGSQRLSTQLDDVIQAVNTAQRIPFIIDYRYAPEGHREKIYCRSDHYSYARFGIPVAFFFTGLHADYHQVTDEPQYIDYDKLTRVTQLVYDITLQVANLPKRLVVDKPVIPPGDKCR